MESNQLARVGELWSQALTEKSWAKTDEALLYDASKEITSADHMPLGRLRFLIGKLLENKFYQSNMAVSFAKHEEALRKQIQALQPILVKRKRIFRGMRHQYLAKQLIGLEDGTTIECEIAASRAGRTISKILGRYSYELIDAEFDRSIIRQIGSELRVEIDSSSPMRLKASVARFISMLKGTDFIESEIARVIDSIIFNWTNCGFSPTDLDHVGSILTLPTGVNVIEALENLLLSATSKWLVLSTLEDLILEKPVEIGRVVLQPPGHDFSSIYEAIRTSSIAGQPEVVQAFKEESVREVKTLEGKVTVEIEIMAHGPAQAKATAIQEISKMIDVLAVHDPTVVIREPKELPQHTLIALDSEHGMAPSPTMSNRLDVLVKKRLDDKAVSRLGHLLVGLDKLLTKDSKSTTEFERRILTALHFYRKGNYAFDALDKVVNYFVALESMLVMKEERPSATLPDRVCDVLGITETTSKAFKNLVSDCYRRRGNILHLGRIEPSLAEEVASSMFEVNRRVIAILLDHIKDPECDTLEHFLDYLQAEAVVQRERIVKTALLEINKKYRGKGILRDTAGKQVGEVGFSFGYEDDGRYIYMLGSIDQFKLSGTLSPGTCSMDANFEGDQGDFTMDLSSSFDQLSLMGLLSGRTESVSFQARDFRRKENRDR